VRKIAYLIKVVGRYRLPETPEDGVLVPVHVNGSEKLFVLDTGASFTFYDTSIDLGKVQKRMDVSTAAGPKEINFYTAPDARMGEARLPRSELVASANLSVVREVAGAPIYGILGMDFLKHHIIRLDFERRELLFLASADARSGESFALRWRDNRPELRAELKGWGTEEFLVDTGLVGFVSGELRLVVYQSLLKNRELTVIGKSLGETLTITVASRDGQCKHLRLGPFDLPGPIFHDASHGSNNSSLGLNYLSRFVATFDFPNGIVYLRKSRRFSDPDLTDLSGLHLLRRAGRTLVDSVEQGSPAAKNGVQKGDELVRLNEQEVHSLTMGTLRRRLATAQESVRLALIRDGQQFEISLPLPGGLHKISTE
jgi:hypothetical protein